MKVEINSFVDAARSATGTAVIIDVFRAFTTAAVVLANGAEKVIMVATVEEAEALRAAGAGSVLMGEVRGRRPPGFDIGNSPFEATTADVRGQTIIQRTGAGTQGVVAAQGADRLFACALVTAAATCRAIASLRPDQVSIVAMGEGGRRTDEDELCASHLRNLLQGRAGNPNAVRDLILAGDRVQEFHDPAKTHFHPNDLDIALDVDRFDFAIEVKIEDGRPVGRVCRAEAA